MNLKSKIVKNLNKLKKYKVKFHKKCRSLTKSFKSLISLSST